MEYYVEGYLASNFSGLMDDLSTTDLDKALDFAWELLNQGYCVKIKNEDTGKSVEYSPDDIDFDEFGFPYDDIQLLMQEPEFVTVDDIVVGESLLRESRWEYEVDKNLALSLREAIKDDDALATCSFLQLIYDDLYEKINDEDIFSEQELEQYKEDIDMIDLDDEDADEAVNYELDNFYDFCDNLNIWIAIDESLTEDVNFYPPIEENSFPFYVTYYKEVPIPDSDVDKMPWNKVFWHGKKGGILIPKTISAVSSWGFNSEDEAEKFLKDASENNDREWIKMPYINGYRYDDGDESAYFILEPKNKYLKMSRLTEADTLHPKIKKDIKTAYKRWDYANDKNNKERAKYRKDFASTVDSDAELDREVDLLYPVKKPFKYDSISNGVEKHDFPFYVTYYEEYPIYEPAEGGYYYEGVQATSSWGFNSKDEALEFLENIIKEDDDDWEEMSDGYINHSRYIGESRYYVVEPRNAYLSKERGWHPYS